MVPWLTSLGLRPVRAAQQPRRSAWRNSWVWTRNSTKACHSACTLGSAKRSAEARCPLTSTGAVEGAERLLSQDAVVGHAFDFQQTTVGLEADFPQSRQVVQPLAHTEIPGVVDRRLGAQGTSFLVILLDARVFVVDVERRRDSLGDHSGPETPR